MTTLVAVNPVMATGAFSVDIPSISLPNGVPVKSDCETGAGRCYRRALKIHETRGAAGSQGRGACAERPRNAADPLTARRHRVIRRILALRLNETWRFTEKPYVENI